jgi:hypothetical protein
MQHAI